MDIKKRLLLSILIVLTAQSVWVVSGWSYDMVKQYYECQHLKMIIGEDGIYYADPDVPGNSLSDSFYQSQDLLSKSFSQAMSFFKKIYDTANLKGNKCKPLCKCLKKSTAQDILLPVYFRNQKTLVGVIKIVSDFANANKEFLINEDYLLDSFPEDTRTLAKFCLRNEFGSQVLYNFTTSYCEYEPTDLEVFDASYEMIFKNGIVQPDNSRAYLESQLVSSILTQQNCSRDKQRFYALLTWGYFATPLTWTGNSLVSYLDGLIKKVLNVEPTIKFTRVSISRGTKFNLFINRIDQTFSQFEILFNSTKVATNFTDTCLKTTNLQIDCTWFLDPIKTNFFMTQLNYTFQFPKNPSGNKRQLSYLINTQSTNFAESGKYVKGPTNKKIIYMKRVTYEFSNFIVYEFSSKINLITYGSVLPTTGFYIYLPTTIAKNVEGVLATGIFNAPWAKAI